MRIITSARGLDGTVTCRPPQPPRAKAQAPQLVALEGSSLEELEKTAQVVLTPKSPVMEAGKLELPRRMLLPECDVLLSGRKHAAGVVWGGSVNVGSCGGSYLWGLAGWCSSVAEEHQDVAIGS